MPVTLRDGTDAGIRKAATNAGRGLVIPSRAIIHNRHARLVDLKLSRR
jgi:hypothetical protein